MLRIVKVKKQTSGGFTIVELLIVIVVIGILAAITIVAYSGMQQRAKNTSRIAAARQTLGAVNAYIAANGKYPLATGTGRCLSDSFPGDICWGVDSPSPAVTTASLNTDLKTIAALPSISYGPVDMGYWRGIGPVYHYRTGRTVDGKPNEVVIVYFLDGLNQDCGLNNVLQTTDVGTAGTVENSATYVTDTTPPRNTASSGTGTYCIVAANTAQ
jgi:prepilin-type N-terminal cleavage/methylation domain-containing protein